MILNDHKQVLLSLRLKNAHQGGKWEFPGGKIEAGESDRDALYRELKEELDIEISNASEYLQLSYDYPEKTVVLKVYLVTEFRGQPSGLEGQKVSWFSVEDMADLTFPDANYPILDRIRQDYL